MSTVCSPPSSGRLLAVAVRSHTRSRRGMRRTTGPGRRRQCLRQHRQVGRPVVGVSQCIFGEGRLRHWCHMRPVKLLHQETICLAVISKAVFSHFFIVLRIKCQAHIFRCNCYFVHFQLAPLPVSNILWYVYPPLKRVNKTLQPLCQTLTSTVAPPLV